MTAKEYLNQARHLDALINCRLREIDYWRNLSSSVSCMKFDGMPHSPNRPTEAPFVRCLEKIDEIQRDVEKKVAYLVRLKEEINAAIDMLASRDEQLLLRYRYLDDFTWEDAERVAPHGASHTRVGFAEFYRTGLKVGTVWHGMSLLTYGMITIAK